MIAPPVPPVAFPIRLRLDGRDRYLAWISDDTDVFATDADGRLRVCRTVRDLDVALQPVPAASWDLDRILARLARGRVDPREVLDAWNLLGDLDATLGGEPFEDRADPYQRWLYDRVFWGANVPAMMPPGARYRPRFSRAHARALERLFRRGVRRLRSALPP